VTGRVEGENPAARGGWGVTITQGQGEVGVTTTIDSLGRATLEPSYTLPEN